MKKKILFISVLLTIGFIACGDSSGSNSVAGYRDPGLSATKIVKTKSYNFSSIGESCSAGTACNAIIYLGTLSDATYTGIAAQNSVTGFTFKMYWKYNENLALPGAGETKPLSGTADKIIITKNSNEQSAADQPFSISITNNTETVTATDGTTSVVADGTYTITFSSSISVGTETIQVNDSIRAYKY